MHNSIIKQINPAHLCFHWKNKVARIEYGKMLNKLYINPCGKVDPSRKYLETLSPNLTTFLEDVWFWANYLYNSSEVQKGLSQLMEERKDCTIMRQNDSNNHQFVPPSCLNSKEKITLRGIIVGIDTSCNLNCTCCLRDNKDNNDLYFSVLEQLKGKNLELLVLTDEGESFINKERIFKYLLSLTTEDVKEVVIPTNATLLTTEDIEELVTKMRAKGIKISFDVSLFGSTEMIYNSVTKTDKYFHTVIANIKKMEELDCLDWIKYFSCNENKSDVNMKSQFKIMGLPLSKLAIRRD